ncbi:hypothetical protein ABEB36_010025 [Hypothenemus hampei]|uniref:Uncharacterized protein n=1 Tax=Hypothenemus hampei TaxID=57062 RepID=A0ABD1EII4_HYPHA
MEPEKKTIRKVKSPDDYAASCWLNATPFKAVHRFMKLDAGPKGKHISVAHKILKGVKRTVWTEIRSLQFVCRILPQEQNPGGLARSRELQNHNNGGQFDSGKDVRNLLLLTYRKSNEKYIHVYSLEIATLVEPCNREEPIKRDNLKVAGLRTCFETLKLR